MTVLILFEGVSDKDFFEILFENEMRQLRDAGIKVICRDYGGRFRGFVRRLPKEITASFEIETVDKVLIHIDSESDSPERMNTLIANITSQLKETHRSNVFWVVIHRNLESIFLAGCLEKERNYEVISDPKKVIKKLLRRKLNRNYLETIQAKEYAALLNKERILLRISGAKMFQNLLTQIH
jgi:hypothetical protein